MRMRIYLLLGVSLCGMQAALAKETSALTSSKASKSSETPSSGPLSHLWLNGMAAYTDFKFNSTTGKNYNIFKGYSKLASIGGNNVQLSSRWTAGVSIFKAETIVGSQLFLSPGVASLSSQSIRNNTLYGHLLNQVKPNYFLDFSAAYGRNKINTTSYIAPGTRSEQIGYAQTHNTNWFASIMGLHTTSWKKLLVTVNGRLLYSEVDSGAYSFIFNSKFPTQIVAPLTNKSWFLMENMELGYNLQQFQSFTTFANAGLVQVLSYQNSRPLVSAAINGLSPQLNLDKNGFHVGAGLGYVNKRFTLRVEEQYYNAGSTYSSFQTLLGIKYALA